ncbi:hypothetical protein ES703_60346 [subsurface metagenome]
MSVKRGKIFSTYLDEDARLELERLAQSSKFDMKFIASHAIMQVAQMKMLDPDWGDRIKELEETHVILNKYAFLDDPRICPLMTYANDYYVCIQGKEGKTLKIQKLSTDLEESIQLCSKCVIAKNMRRELEEAKDSLVTLETRLAKGMVYEIPSCKKGGELGNDGKKLYCLDPKKSAQWRDVKKFCRVVRSGANCEYLKWTRIAVKGKKPELNDKSL